jgi:hypothetical protein
MDSRIERHAVSCPLCRNSDVTPHLINLDLLFTILRFRSAQAVFHDIRHSVWSIKSLIRSMRDQEIGSIMPIPDLNERLDRTLEDLDYASAAIRYSRSLFRSPSQTPEKMNADDLLQVSENMASFFRLNCIFLVFDTPAELVEKLDSAKCEALSYAMFQTIAVATSQSVDDKVYLRYSREGKSIKGTAILPPEVVIDQDRHVAWELAQFVAASVDCEITTRRNSQANVIYWTTPVL